jgi:hypothetical protein
MKKKLMIALIVALMFIPTTYFTPSINFSAYSDTPHVYDYNYDSDYNHDYANYYSSPARHFHCDCPISISFGIAMKQALSYHGEIIKHYYTECRLSVTRVMICIKSPCVLEILTIPCDAETICAECWTAWSYFICPSRPCLCPC